jgi:hypothetical protein
MLSQELALLKTAYAKGIVVSYRQHVRLGEEKINDLVLVVSWAEQLLVGLTIPNKDVSVRIARGHYFTIWCHNSDGLGVLAFNCFDFSDLSIENMQVSFLVADPNLTSTNIHGRCFELEFSAGLNWQITSIDDQHVLRLGQHIDLTFVCSKTESLVWQCHLLNFLLVLEPAQKLVKAGREDGPRVCGKTITRLLMGGRDIIDFMLLTNSEDIVFRSVPNALANWK